MERCCQIEFARLHAVDAACLKELGYLYFASHKPVAANIVRSIFTKYRERGGS